MSAAATKPQKQKETFGEFIRSLAVAGALALLIRTFLFAPFVIPSGSMKPTCLIGDFLFVSKFSYGFSNVSLPFSPPLIEGRILGKMPERGDVVVFRPVHDLDQDYIKRVMAFPGEKIQVKDGRVFINDKELPLRKLDQDFYDTLYIDYAAPGQPRVRAKPGLRMDQYMQTLPGGFEHVIAKEKPFGEGRLDNTPVYTVPEGHLFVMGDNRDGSDDSRNMRFMGFVPVNNLVGKAQIIFLSTESNWYEVWRWLFDIRWDRFFQMIR